MTPHAVGVSGLCMAAACAVILGGCGGETTPASPSRLGVLPTPSASPDRLSPFAPRDISGTAFEFAQSGDRRPIAGLRLKLRIPGPSDGAVGGGELPDVMTDENGRYLIRDVTVSYLFVSAAAGSPYRFLCDQYPLFGSDRFGSDLPLVHISWSGDRPPPALTWIAGTSVWGRVVERHGDLLLPSAGATVTLDEGVSDPPAATNAAGFYMVCSAVGGDQVRTISARKNGYRTSSREIFGGWEPEVHFELTPE